MGIREKWSTLHKQLIDKSLYEYNSNKTKIIRIVRMAFFALENYKKTKSNLWASSLSFYSLLSIVPLLAIAFSIAKGLGADALIKEEILKNSPLQPEALEKLLTFSDKLLDSAKGGIMAGAGILFLGWSVIKIFSLVERSFNEIWGVKRGRVFVRKFTDYFSIVFLFPMVMLLSNGLIATMQIYFLEREGIVSTVIKLTPYILMVLFFTLIYLIIPNTKVKLTNAFVAGMFTALLYNLIQFILLRSQVFLLNYNKIYGSFSVVPIFIIWQKAIWFIIILGAHLSFILQNSYKFGYTIGEARMCIRSRREALFAIVYILTQNYRMEKPPLSIEELGYRLSISMGEVGQLVEALLDVDIILEVSTPSEERLFKINKNINTFTLGKFIEIIETYGHSRKIGGEEMEETMERFNQIYKNREWNILIKDL